MPCGHASSGDSQPSTRRRFLKAALAAGGATALSACLDAEIGADTPEQDLSEFPRGPSDLSELPARQHAWREYFIFDRFGNTVFPQYHEMLFLDYVGDAPPSGEDRERVEAAFRTLERAFQRGTSGAKSAIHHDGLLFTMGYSPRYFGRYDGELPATLDLTSPGDLLDELDEDATTVEHDAALHFASGFASIVLAAEEMLFEGLDRINGVEVEGDLRGLFEVAERRTGFIGKGQPAKRYDDDRIPHNAPLSMGFKGGFADNLPEEDRITIRDGPFAEGTTQMISRIDIDLDGWYGEAHEDQVKQIYTPEHTVDQVGEHGENLAGHSRKTPETVDRMEADAKEGLLGHGQKLAQARDDDFVPIITRRDFNVTGEPGMVFNSWQRGIGDFVETRKAMNAPEYEDAVPRENNGILEYIDVKSRGTFLIPPRSLRALPSPSPETR